MVTRGLETPLPDMRTTEVSHASTSSMASASGTGMTTTSNKESKLPLPDDYFKPPALSGKDRAYLIGLAKRACKEVVYYSRLEGGPMTWVHLSSDDGIELCQGVDESAAAPAAATATGSAGSAAAANARSLIYLRGATKIYASIDEVADFFKLDTPEKLSGFAQTVGKDIMDQKTLYTLATPTPENPKHYVAAKWTAIESPSKLARNRDFCYLECHDEFIDTNSKKRGWVRSVHSIRLPFCPRLDRSHGLVRGSLYRSGFIFIESSEPGCVDAIHTLHMDVKGNSPNWIKVLAMKRRIKNIAQVNKYFQLQRLTQSKLLGDLELPAKAGVTRCQACQSKFGLFNRKWRCRKCGKVICTPCGTSFLVDYAAGAGPKKVRVCIACSDAVVFGGQLDDQHGAGAAADGGGVKHVKRVNDADVQPIYDPSPMASDDDMTEASQHLSVEEHDYYLEHEDQRGIADMLECKRMQHAFENHLKLSGGPPHKERSSASAVSARDHYRQNESIGTESMSGATLPTDSLQWDPVDFDENLDDDDELGLPRSKSEQQRTRFDELLLRQQEQQLKSEQQKELHAATQTVSYQQHAPRSLGRTSSQRRSSKEDEQQQTQTRFRFANGALLEHQDPAYQHFRHMEHSGDHLRKESLEAIRIASDWGYDHAAAGASDTLSQQQQHHHHIGSYPSTTSSFLSATGPVSAAVRRSDLSSEGSRSSSFVREHSGESVLSSGFRHAPPPASSRTGSFLHHTYDDSDDDVHVRQRLSSSEFATPHRSFHQTESLLVGTVRRVSGGSGGGGGGGGHDRRYGSNDSGEYESRSPYFGPRRGDPELDERVGEHHAYRREPPPRYTDVITSDFGLDTAYSESPMSSFHRRVPAAGGGGGSGSAAHEPLAPMYSPHLGAVRRTGSGDSSSNVEPILLQRPASRADVRDRDELAHYMALSAMKLFEMEQGPSLQVPEDVRQTALSKMMAVYANEIERSSGGAGGASGSVGMDRRTYNAQTRYSSTPMPTPTPVRRSASHEAWQQRDPYYQQHDRHEHGDRRDDHDEQVPILEHSSAYERGYMQHKSSPAVLQPRRSSARELLYHSMQDLSDLSSSAFQAYQIGSDGAPVASPHHHTHGKALPSECQSTVMHQQHQHHSGLRRNDSFMGRPSPQQAAELRESISSSRLSGSSTAMQRESFVRGGADAQSHASGASHGSSSDHRLSLLRPESVYEDAESDTFSELDFVELPHLMRKDYVAPPPPASCQPPPPGATGSDDPRFPNSFTDVHQWQHSAAELPASVSLPSSLSGGGGGDNGPSISRDSIYHEGVERRLSELSPDDHIFRRSSEGFANRSSSEFARDSLSISSSSTRLSGSSSTTTSSRPPPPSYAATANSVLAMHTHSNRVGGGGTGRMTAAVARSEVSSSSYSSDEPDYVTEEDLNAVELSTARAQMSLSELERYRASLAELMSDYTRSTGLGHRASIAESTTSSLSIGSAGFYSAAAETQSQQPEREREPEDAARCDPANKPSACPIERRLQEMYL